MHWGGGDGKLRAKRTAWARALWQEHAVSREGGAIGLYSRGKWGEG